MNIPSTNSVSGASASSHSFQRVPKMEDPAQFPAADVTGSGTPTAPTEGDGTHAGKRLRDYASKMETRLQNALASRDLTPRQRAAIEGQSKKFHGLMKRLENAYLTGSGPQFTMPLQGIQKELDRVASSVGKILSGAKPTGAQISTGSLDVPSGEQHGGLDTVA